VKACRVAWLAAAVLTHLDHWPFAIGILAGFARVQVFRNAVIEHGSEILEKLVSGVDKTSSGRR